MPAIFFLLHPYPTSAVNLSEMFNVSESPFKHMGLVAMDRMRAAIATKAEKLHKQVKSGEFDIPAMESLRSDLRRYFPYWHVFSTHAENLRHGCNPSRPPRFVWALSSSSTPFESQVMRFETVCLSFLYGCVSSTLAECLADKGERFTEHHNVAFRLFAHVCQQQSRAWILMRSDLSSVPSECLTQSGEAMKCMTMLALQRRALFAAKKLTDVDEKSKIKAVIGLAAWGLEATTKIADLLFWPYVEQVKHMRAFFLEQFLLANSILWHLKGNGRNAAILGNAVKGTVLAERRKTTRFPFQILSFGKQKTEEEPEEDPSKQDKEILRVILMRSPTLGKQDSVAKAIRISEGHYYAKDNLGQLQGLGFAEKELRDVYCTIVK